jgi:cytosine/creatinine deaminase
MTRFRELTIPAANGYRLRNARVPMAMLARPIVGASLDGDGCALIDLMIAGGSIEAIIPAGAGVASALPAADLNGCLVWPGLVDMHTHLDKGHIVVRTNNPDGSFTGARLATIADRSKYWTEKDVRRRMEFGLRCAYAHGVAAIRTHIDSYEGQSEISWKVFREVREAWRGKIALQAVSICPIDLLQGEPGVKLADLVVRSGGVLGGATRAFYEDHAENMADLDALLDRLFTLAAERSLDVDLHVDETGDPNAASLIRVADAAIRNKFKGKVVCGHCCSLSVQPEPLVRETLQRCADAGIAIVSLPIVNMYLQDRGVARTPRWRGVTLIHEMRSAGIEVAVAGDNCRDPFHAYGDHDMVDTFRQAVRIAHLDHPFGDITRMIGPAPAGIMGVLPLGTIAAGTPARLILFSARTLNELVCRPQADRIVIKDGKRLDAELPDYAELDDELGLAAE